MRRGVLIRIGLVALVGAGWLTVARPAQAAIAYNFTPTSGPVGTTIHVTGTGCPPGGAGEPVSFTIDNGPGRSGSFPSKADGSFSFDYVIPEARAGEQSTDNRYPTSLYCATTNEDVSEGPVFALTGPTYRFEPSSASPGTTVTVTGLGCVQDNDATLSGQFSFDDKQVATFKPDQSAAFTFTFTVPDLKASEYTTALTCRIQQPDSPSGPGEPPRTTTQKFTLRGRAQPSPAVAPTTATSGVIAEITPNEATNAATLTLVNPDGSVRQRDVGPADSSSPAWSVDGKQLAVLTSGSGGDHPPSVLWVMNADGTNLHSATLTAEATDLEWLPTGDIAVTRSFSGIAKSNQPPLLFHADGSTTTASYPSHPFGTSYSAEGHVAYLNGVDYTSIDTLNVGALDGSGDHVVATSADATFDTFLDFDLSREGRTIVAIQDETVPGAGGSVATFDVATGTKKVLRGSTNEDQSVIGRLRAIRWAPDGQGFFGVALGGQAGDIYKIGLDGRTTNLMAPPASQFDVQPVPVSGTLPRTSGSSGGEPPAPSSAVTDAAARAAHASGRSPLALALHAPENISTDLALVLTNLLLAIGIALLVFPAVLFNSTLEDHYDEVRGWFGRKPRDPHAPRVGSARRWASFVTVALITAALASMLDPKIKADRATLLLALGVGVATIITTVLGHGVKRIYLREARGRITSYPGGAIVGAVTVGVSRAVHFLPGYLYGIVGGFETEPKPDKGRAGRAAALGELFAIALALGAWFAWQPISHSASRPHASAGIAVADAVFSAVAALSFQGLLFSMIPIKPLPGDTLWKWNRAAWAAFMTIGAFSFLHVLAHPAKKYTGSVTVMVALFAVFGAASIAFWAFFRFQKPKKESPDPPPPPPPEPEVEPGAATARPRRERPLRAPGR